VPNVMRPGMTEKARPALGRAFSCPSPPPSWGRHAASAVPSALNLSRARRPRARIAMRRGQASPAVHGDGEPDRDLWREVRAMENERSAGGSSDWLSR